jgi:hypothetical protein
VYTYKQPMSVQVYWKRQWWLWRSPDMPVVTTWEEVRSFLASHFGFPTDKCTLLHGGEILSGDLEPGSWTAMTSIHAVFRGDPAWVALGARALLSDSVPAVGLGYYEWPAFLPPRQRPQLRAMEAEAPPPRKAPLVVLEPELHEPLDTLLGQVLSQVRVRTWPLVTINTRFIF